jgi:hypothetical protein
VIKKNGKFKALLCVVILWVGFLIFDYLYIKENTMSKETRENINKFKNFLLNESKKS